MRRIPAFTLVELLVVISIIVVLLALLAPAMDKAIYSAELATCMARLKGIHGAVSVYATQHQRAYPHRPGAAYLKSIPHMLSRRNPTSTTVSSSRPT